MTRKKRICADLSVLIRFFRVIRVPFDFHIFLQVFQSPFFIFVASNEN
jgi:hypothetical protein